MREVSRGVCCLVVGQGLVQTNRVAVVSSLSDPNLVQPGMDIGPGHVLGRYELLLPIASGGMAMVWAARLKGTRGFQKIVAVKTMLPKLSEDEQFEQMFLDEASLASEIHHPHVVEILDLGEQQGVLFLVMEWIDGVPLNQIMKAARAASGVPIPVAVRIAMQACGGLHAAHELRNGEGKLVGLVHRDISPQNIMVTYDGVAKVVDFGVAKATAFGGGATVAGQIKGKVAYMAPEQVRGGALDRRVDLFAMGIVLYALTTGKHPFRRESEAATMYNICAPQPVMPPRKVVPDYPHELERIVLQALAKDPDRRFQSATEMLRALDQLPGELRASTDEEVAIFVRNLFGAKREERQQALSEALARADEAARNRGPALPAFPGHSYNSGVTMTSGSGVTGAELSGIPSGTGTGMVTMVGEASPRRRLVFAASAVAVMVLFAGIVLGIMSSRRQPLDTAASAPTVSTGKPLTEPSSRAPGPASAAPTQSSEAPVSSATAVASAAPEGATSAVPNTGPRGVTGGPRSGGRWPPSGSGSGEGARKGTSWKHDPGF